MDSHNHSSKRRLLLLPLLMLLIFVGNGDLHATSHFNGSGLSWVKHTPTMDEPWFYVDMIFYDTDDNDSFFLHDKADGSHDGPAVWINDQYVCSPNYELAWPGATNTGNGDGALSEVNEHNEWWTNAYETNDYIVRFYNPYKSDHNKGKYYRVMMYVFIKVWKPGNTYKVKVKGKWKINGDWALFDTDSNEWEEITLTSAGYPDPWGSVPTARMTNYNTVSVSGSLNTKYGPTTVGLYTQSTSNPGSYLSNSGAFAKTFSYLKGNGAYNDLSTTLTMSNYANGTTIPVQYSTTLNPKAKDYEFSTTVYKWFDVKVPGFIYPTKVENVVTNQWDKKVKISWEVEDDNTRSHAGTWTIYNATLERDIITGLSHETRNWEITLDNYHTAYDIDVYFIPSGLGSKPAELKASTKVSVEPTWDFCEFTATENEEAHIDLAWSHHSIGDASGSNVYKLHIERSTDYDPEDPGKATWGEIGTMDITSTETNQGTYTDSNNLDPNTSYFYRLKISVFNEQQLSDVACVKLGGTTIQTFTASRGTYSNLVKLNWSVRQVGSSTNYTVQRRPLGSRDERAWATIYNTSGSVTNYSYDDVTALPGSFNAYRVIAWTTQGGERQDSHFRWADGFSLASGIVNGNISYDTGTAVEGAKVILKPQDPEGELSSTMRSVHFLGVGSGLKYATDNDGIKALLAKDFSVQMYINPDTGVMLDNSSRYMLLDIYSTFTFFLRYHSDADNYTLGCHFRFVSGSGSAGYDYESTLSLKAGEWTNVGAIYDATTGTVTLFIADKNGPKKAIPTYGHSLLTGLQTFVHDEAKCISIGNDANFSETQFRYVGFMDEFRFFTKALSDNDILRNYNHPLAGGETGLAIYYPLDEGLSKQVVAYDFSKTNGVSNGRHALTKVPPISSPNIPDEDQLSLMSYTDTNGYYEIRGIPFSGEGTSYSIIPSLGIHEFSPSTRSRYVSASSLNHSGVDFQDVSSFPVSGKVYYAGTDYPVKGAYLYVDGVICSKDGQIIETDEQGAYSISVPIGDHFITVEMNGHVFSNEGRYPAGVGLKHTFNQEIKNLDFYDETLVNFTGRVVGGDIEGEKKVGFGLSKNNIGVAELVLTPLNETPRMNVVKDTTETTYSYETNADTVSIASASGKINSTSWRGEGAENCRKLFIHTDPRTGEFSAMVPPLEYKIGTIKVVATGLEVGPSTTIDLTNALSEHTDTLRNDDGSKETYTYHTKLLQTYHSTPTFNVTQNDHNDGAFGITSYTMKDDLGEVLVDDIYTIENGAPVYKYGGPIFQMYDNYNFNIKAFEDYVNNDGETPDYYQAPLQGLVVTIDNALSIDQTVYNEDTMVDGQTHKAGEVANLKSNQLRLDSIGQASYRWTAGLPNISDPYTRTICITYDIDDRTYQWNGNGLAGIVLGDMPTGSNFITAGPDMLDMILRDPPGSKSSAEWTTGTVTSHSTSEASAWDTDNHGTATIKLGLNTTVATGIGVVAVSNVESKFDQVIGANISSQGESGNTWNRSVEVTKAIATSGDKEFVGPQGDVFIGSATNIIFGNSRNLGFHRVDSIGNDVQLSVEDAITTGMSFSTMFNYTQSYIENMLIPNLKTLRNSMLQTTTQDRIDSYVNNGTLPVYLTTLLPNDPGFGQNNIDQHDKNGNVVPSSKGSSYTMFIPEQHAADQAFQDSILWCNSQIEIWENYLALNEREKVSAYKNRENPDSVVHENYSFDSGTSVTNSTENDETNGTHSEWNVTAKLVLNGGTGVLTNGVGVIIDVGTSSGGGKKESEDDNVTQKTSFKYTLADEGDDNSLTVDVYGYGAYSPIFRTLGGQTSGPYEGKVVTKYYNPGTTIMESTMQIEVPQIYADNPVVTDIPSGSTATYTLRLSNASESNEILYYRLMQAEETNPDGAMLFVDGMPLTDARMIKIPPFETVTKTLLLKQSDQSILDYDRIGIVLASQTQYYPTYTWDPIADTVFVSAHYVPSSSPVTLELSNTTLNTQTGTDLVLTMKDFDRTYRGLKAFRMQYKKQGATDWTQIHEYVLDEDDKTDNNELLPASGSEVTYQLPMESYSDGNYLFRIVSASTYGTDEVTRTSDEIALVKDMQRPTPLGQPEPTDGVLDIGDELSVTFNESILKGELTEEANFKVTGVLNGAEIDHETALDMQDTDVTAATESTIMLADKDFSFDVWVNLTGGEGTLLSHGSGTSKLTVGTNASNKLVVNVGGTPYTSINTIPTGKWAFLSLSYENTGEGGILNASVADDANTTTLFTNEAVVKYEGNGPLAVGKNLTGAMHELLLWDEAHDMTTALLNRSKTKSPSTRHLVGYWKMDEGEGTSIRDYSRNRHMTMPAETWYLNNENKAVNFNGQSYLSINASELPTCPDDDYALEFWVRGGAQSGDAQLLQMGDVALWVAADGTLKLTGKDAYLSTSGANAQFSTSNTNLLDNVWHHVALNVLRQGAAAVYVDGKRCLSTNTANVGSIVTNNLIVGARRTTVSAADATYSYDRAFKGQVDEVRVWNATMPADLLAKNRKVRLTGSEDGLVAYYPFEKKKLDSGNQVVTVGDSLDLTGSGLEAKLFALNSSPSPITYTDQAPALRTKPTETNVGFSFVASDEKVVITLNEDAAILDGCTLNFTVRDVRDENGNYSIPAVWSAFVNQNELQWSESELSTVCHVTNTTGRSLAVNLVNKSGKQQMWTLSGMPSWLVVSNDYGNINPLGTATLTFTVDEDAPIGKHEETVYVTGNNGIETPLTLHITVKGEEPQWAVNPDDYEDMMNLVGELYILGTLSTDADDIVAAFVGDDCRGVARPEYSSRYDSYFVSMDIYGNGDDEGTELEFRVFDASTATIYPMVKTSQDVRFVPTDLVGRYNAPIRLSAIDMGEQTIALNNGWNWMALNVTPDPLTVSNVFKQLNGQVSTVKSQSGGSVVWAGDWFGPLASMNNVEMYAVQTIEPTTLKVKGHRVNPSQTPVTLKYGWNWVAYNGQQTVDLTDALAGMAPRDGDIIKSQRGVAYYDDYEWAGSLRSLTPGLGYKIQSVTTADRTFSYGGQTSNVKAQIADVKSQTLGGDAQTGNSEPHVFSPVDCGRYAGNMVLCAKVVDGFEPVPGIEIGIFADDECRQAAVTDAQGMLYLTIPGDDECELTFRVSDGEVVGILPITLTYTTDAVYGRPRAPYIIDLGTVTAIASLNGNESAEAVFDLAGRKVVAGKWSNRNLNKGIYIVNGQKKAIK